MNEMRFTGYDEEGMAIYTDAPQDCEMEETFCPGDIEPVMRPVGTCTKIDFSKIEPDGK